MYQILLLSIAVAAISVSLTRGKIFRKQRLWVSKRSPFFGGLLACPYCTCHWVSFFFLNAFPAGMYDNPNIWANWVTVIEFGIISWFSIVGIAALFIGVILKLIQFAPDETAETLDKLRSTLKKVNEELLKRQLSEDPK